MRGIRKAFGSAALLICAVFGTVLVLGEGTVLAQAAGGGRGRSARGGGARPAQPPKDKPGPRQNPEDSMGTSQYGRLVKYAAAKEGEDDGELGILSFKPLDAKLPLLRLIVKDSEEVRVRVGSAEFTGDQIGGVIWKGLYGTVQWTEEGEGAKKKRNMTQLTLDTVAVEGTIEAIDAEMITLKVKPTGGKQWPHLPEEKPIINPKAKGEPKPKPIRALKLKLKIVEDVTSYKEGDSQRDLSDFEKGQSVKASVVYGSKQGILVELQTAGESGDDTSASRGDDGGPKPRGGRG